MEEEEEEKEELIRLLAMFAMSLAISASSCQTPKFPRGAQFFQSDSNPHPTCLLTIVDRRADFRRLLICFSSFLSENPSVSAKTHLSARDGNSPEGKASVSEKSPQTIEQDRNTARPHRCAQERLKRNRHPGASSSLIARTRGPASLLCVSPCPSRDGRVGREGIEEGLPQSATAHHVFPLRRRRAKEPLFY